MPLAVSMATCSKTFGASVDVFGPNTTCLLGGMKSMALHWSGVNKIKICLYIFPGPAPQDPHGGRCSPNLGGSCAAAPSPVLPAEA